MDDIDEMIARIKAFNERSTDPSRHFKIVCHEWMIGSLYACEIKTCCEHPQWARCFMMNDLKTVSVHNQGPCCSSSTHTSLDEIWQVVDEIREEENEEDAELGWELEDWVSSGLPGGCRGPPLRRGSPVLEFTPDNLWGVDLMPRLPKN